MNNALEDILVIELGTVLTAPLAGMMLGDLGARVIKVEHPAGGDPFRRHAGKLYSPHFASYNRNKESIQLDLQTESGKADLLTLLARADVLLENYRPGVMERLGLTQAVLDELNPRLVWCSITGFGAEGPYRDRPCYDAVALGLSGLASLMLDPGAPSMNGPTISDNVTGMYAAYGILGALMRRARSGEGARVEVNMLEASIAFSPEGFAQYTRLGAVPTPRTRVAISQSHAFRCADASLVTVHLSSVEKFWQAFVAVLERPDLLADERFLTPELRTRNYEALNHEAAATFCTRARPEWCARLAQHDVPFAPVYTLESVMQDEQVRKAGTFYEVEHPEQGRMIAIHRPVTIDGARGPSTRAAPVLGEHGEALRREFKLG
jgi:formyl-CoA transferase